MVESETRIFEVVELAFEQGSEINLTMHDVKREHAVKIMDEFAGRLGRTWQECENGELSWLELVTHDKDQIDITVFLK